MRQTLKKSLLIKIRILAWCLLGNIFFSSCITTMYVNNIKGNYKADQIKEVKNYYAESENTLVIQFTAKLEKQEGFKDYYYELDIDELLHTINSGTPGSIENSYYDNGAWGPGFGIDFIRKSANGDEFFIGISREAVNEGVSGLLSGDILFIADSIELISGQPEHKNDAFNTLTYKLPTYSIPELYPVENLSLYFERNRKQAWYKYPLYPISIAVDIITFPAQVVVAIIVGTAYGNAFRS